MYARVDWQHAFVLQYPIAVSMRENYRVEREFALELIRRGS